MWGEGYEDESPLKERSSSLQEISQSSPWSNSRKVEHSQSAKMGSSTGKHPTPLTGGGEGTSQLGSASSLKYLMTLAGGKESQLTSSSSLKQLTSPSLLTVPMSRLLSQQDRTVSQPELYASTNMHRKQLLVTSQRSSSSEGLASSSLSLPLSPLSTSSSGGLQSGSGHHLNTGGGGEEGEEVAVIDIYVLKQVTNFYHLLKGLWNDARIVSVYVGDRAVDISLPAESSVTTWTSPSSYQTIVS